MSGRGESAETDPIVVFGTGGSGTRAVAGFLSACGVAMGRNLNKSLDALEFTQVLAEHIPRVIRRTRSLDYDADDLPTKMRQRFIADFRGAVERHRGGVPTSSTLGLKVPTTIFVLPLINDIIPGARFVHVIRDGRDMLLSENRNQPNQYFEALFGRKFKARLSDVALFWAKTNSEARAFGKRCLKERYVLLRLEDACGENRRKYLKAFADALGIERQTALRHADAFKQQDSFGRGGSLKQSVPDEFRAALALFRYI